MSTINVYENGKFMSLYSGDELGDMVTRTVNYYQRQAHEARAQAAKTHEEVKQDVLNEYEAENTRLHEDASLVYGRFSFPEEKERYLQFIDDHYTCRITSKINGGKFPYVKEFGTGIGTAYEVVCPCCGKSQDITYTEGW